MDFPRLLRNNSLMTDLDHILPLWRALESEEGQYLLATVVAVEGPSYRKPGARMLLAPDGRRAGTVSGGCLEAEVVRRAWWLTAQGPVVERYSTAEDDGEHPYGSGCGGVVYILLERRETAGPLLNALEPAFHDRTPLAIATILEGPRIGQRAFAGPTLEPRKEPEGDSSLQLLAAEALALRAPIDRAIRHHGAEMRAWADYRPARPGLWIFGAGDDARPLVRMARELGWFVALADGRSHLATRERFPEADIVRVLPAGDPSCADAAATGVKSTDAAVVMAHSFEQDARLLAALLVLDRPPAYLGVLGPQRRTRDLLAEAARTLRLPEDEDRLERWLEEVHAPMGLDLNAEAPASIALSILAEIQQSLTGASGLPLRKVRTDRSTRPATEISLLLTRPDALPALQETGPAKRGEPSMPVR